MASKTGVYGFAQKYGHTCRNAAAVLAMACRKAGTGDPDSFHIKNVMWIRNGNHKMLAKSAVTLPYHLRGSRLAYELDGHEPEYPIFEVSSQTSRWRDNPITMHVSLMNEGMPNVHCKQQAGHSKLYT